MYFSKCVDFLDFIRWTNLPTIRVTVCEQRRDNNLKQLLQIGTCGLHAVLNKFKHGGKASGWAIDKGLGVCTKSLINQSPTQRGDYGSFTWGIYFLQFSSLRWGGNQTVAERAIDVWDNMVIVVNYWLGLPKAKQLN